MKAISSLVASFVVVICACSGSSSGTGGAAPDSSVKKGAETAPDTTTSPSTPQPTGKSCSAAADCAYYFCKCADGAIVNSRLCAQGTCQGASAHCASACTTFNHGGWTGVFGGGDTTTPPVSNTPDSGTSPKPEGSCTSKEECTPFQCGCTNGSRISVRDCYGGLCQNAQSGCQSACEDSGRGDWDGT